MSYLEDTLLKWPILPSSVAGSWLAAELAYYLFPVSTGSDSNSIALSGFSLIAILFIFLLSYAIHLCRLLVRVAIHHRRQARKIPMAVAFYQPTSVAMRRCP